MTTVEPELFSLTEDQRRDQLLKKLARTRQELEAFRDDVRQRIIDRHERGGWCRQGTEDALAELDLAPYELVFSGRCRVEVTFTVRDAPNEDVAHEWVHSAINVRSDDSDVEIDNYDTSVEEIERD
ncbi:hypothetical protein ACFS2C_19415 [Prauserella oleivorans]|uniref:Uncharacterized protein n=2 Tax=Prauserella TaxID=142577 RepID=A0A2V4AVU6_9PSEU|nr:hypothetical protein [Prauserella muralis]PXY25428.1 hypothetical protein BAY60_18815 [Prauserella muralis]TWE27547.1 hypothetical protein FHX69_0183 [Prauserella muralis]